MHRGGLDVHSVAVAVLDWTYQTTLILSHVLLHDFVVCIELLTDRLTNVAGGLRAHQLKLLSLLTQAIRLDQSHLVPVIHIRGAFIN